MQAVCSRNVVAYSLMFFVYVQSSKDQYIGLLENTVV